MNLKIKNKLLKLEKMVVLLIVKRGIQIMWESGSHFRAESEKVVGTSNGSIQETMGNV